MPALPPAGAFWLMLPTAAQRPAGLIAPHATGSICLLLHASPHSIGLPRTPRLALPHGASLYSHEGGCRLPARSGSISFPHLAQPASGSICVSGCCRLPAAQALPAMTRRMVLQPDGSMLNTCTSDALVEMLRFLKRAFWPFPWSTGMMDGMRPGGFAGAAKVQSTCWLSSLATCHGLWSSASMRGLRTFRPSGNGAATPCCSLGCRLCSRERMMLLCKLCLGALHTACRGASSPAQAQVRQGSGVDRQASFDVRALLVLALAHSTHACRGPEAGSHSV